MKKLMYLISAIAGAVGFSTAANADISVSGSGSLAVVNDGADATTDAYNASGVAFALSTTTSNGMGISMSMGISEASDDGDLNVTGGDAVTFSTGGATIVIGGVGTVGAGTGNVGGVNGDYVDIATVAGAAVNDIAVTSGDGFTLSTAMGGATVTIGYVADSVALGNAGDSEMNLTNATSTAAGATLSMPMGAMTTTVGFANADTTTESETSVGGSVSLAAGAGTLTVGMNQSALTDGAGGTSTAMGATYAMSLDADTSLSVGFNNTKDETNNNTTTEINLSRSLGGGASVFIDVENVSGDGANTGTAFALGSSFSF